MCMLGIEHRPSRRADNALKPWAISSALQHLDCMFSPLEYVLPGLLKGSCPDGWTQCVFFCLSFWFFEPLRETSSGIYSNWAWQSWFHIAPCRAGKGIWGGCSGLNLNQSLPGDTVSSRGPLVLHMACTQTLVLLSIIQPSGFWVLLPWFIVSMRIWFS